MLCHCMASAYKEAWQARGVHSAQTLKQQGKSKLLKAVETFLEVARGEEKCSHLANHELNRTNLQMNGAVMKLFL